MNSSIKNPPKSGDKNSKAKKKMTIKYKINRRRAQPVDHSQHAKPTFTEAVETSEALKKRPSKNPTLSRQQKRNSMGPKGMPTETGGFPSIAKPLSNLNQIKEDEVSSESVEEGDGENPLLEMTEEQVSAFREIFHMFDSNGGGTIRSEDLDHALRSVNIRLPKEEVNELFDGMDVDGNGEIDFDEFIRLVANTEKFIESIMSRGQHEAETDAKPLHGILFDALAQFMKQSALASVNEIVRYYHTNAQRYSNPHDVIGHYTAGARLIGLTERQMRRDMKKLTKISSDNKSPYAQPLVTSLDTFFEEKAKPRKLAIKQRKGKDEVVPADNHLDRNERGRIRLKFMACVTPSKPRNRRDSLYLQFLTMQKHIRKQKCIRRGTMSKEIRTLGLTCPGVNLPQLTTISELTSNGNGKNKQIKAKLAQDLTFDDLKLIRKQVSSITTNFYKRVRDEKLKAADKHWQDLGTDDIKSQDLRESFQKSFLAYTDYKHIPICSIASSYSKTNPLFVRL
ncbi:uncharacterized protein LOC135681710 [Rhopilema esculentum]|uniref:uncharacterized protein LOC135681710 n=1 Tax=Rhopilema esculentum TaxID=499914 RepID=UPI0031D630E8|eukprot:gene13562-4450_t